MLLLDGFIGHFDWGGLWENCADVKAEPIVVLLGLEHLYGRDHLSLGSETQVIGQLSLKVLFSGLDCG